MVRTCHWRQTYKSLLYNRTAAPVTTTIITDDDDVCYFTQNRPQWLMVGYYNHSLGRSVLRKMNLVKCKSNCWCIVILACKKLRPIFYAILGTQIWGNRNLLGSILFARCPLWYSRLLHNALDWGGNHLAFLAHWADLIMHKSHNVWKIKGNRRYPLCGSQLYFFIDIFPRLEILS